MKILRNLNPENVIFIDVETVRGYSTLDKAPAQVQEAWNYKMRYQAEKLEDMEPAKAYYDKAALYPEFGKVVCISLGKITDGELTVTSSYEGQELKTGKVVSSESEIINNAFLWISHVGKGKAPLCGHAIKGFDIPYVFKRALVNDLTPLDIFDTSDLKPWEVNALDTLELWKGTGYYSASLLAIATALGLPSPKSNISGAEVSDLYYSKKKDKIIQIKDYCEMDVKTVVNIVRRIRKESIYE